MFVFCDPVSFVPSSPIFSVFNPVPLMRTKQGLKDVETGLLGKGGLFHGTYPRREVAVCLRQTCPSRGKFWARGIVISRGHGPSSLLTQFSQARRDKTGRGERQACLRDPHRAHLGRQGLPAMLPPPSCSPKQGSRQAPLPLLLP